MSFLFHSSQKDRNGRVCCDAQSSLREASPTKNFSETENETDLIRIDESKRDASGGRQAASSSPPGCHLVSTRQGEDEEEDSERRKVLIFGQKKKYEHHLLFLYIDRNFLNSCLFIRHVLLTDCVYVVTNRIVSICLNTL